MSSEEKIDVEKMLSFIPSASSIYSRQVKVTEKRVKLIYDAAVEEGKLVLSKRLATQLGITDRAEISVGSGRVRVTLAAVIDESSSDDTVVKANPDQMRSLGVADGSTVVVRAPR